MAKFIDGLINYNGKYKRNDVIFFTANQVVKKNGDLIMGTGNAKSARNSKFNVAGLFGKTLGSKRVHVEQFAGVKIGALVTKDHYRNKSNLLFVTESLRHLYNYAISNPEQILHIPYPAIGNGGLTKSQVGLILEHLPDNVIIYNNPKKNYI